MLNLNLINECQAMWAVVKPSIQLLLVTIAVAVITTVSRDGTGSPGHGSRGQQFGSGLGRVTGQSSDPDFDPGSCLMPISHTLYSSTEFGY